MWRTLLALAIVAGQAHAEDIFANRPGFSPAEVSPASSARCEQLREAAENLPDPGTRIDLSVTGKLTLVKSDGALWYLVVCSDVRVMCVPINRTTCRSAMPSRCAAPIGGSTPIM